MIFKQESDIIKFALKLGHGLILKDLEDFRGSVRKCLPWSRKDNIL